MNFTIDASVFVAASRPAESNHTISFEFLQRIDKQDILTSCPTLLLTECAAAIARATHNENLAQQLVILVEALPGLTLVPLSRTLAYRAAEIAIRHRLRGADAIYVAVAEQVGHILVSWDHEMLERGQAIVKTATPADILPRL